ncbi:hypothetical protein D3C79_576920 [compost metagenome]
MSTNGHPRADTAGQGHGSDARVLDGLGDAVGGDVDDFEHTFRYTGLLEHIAHQVGAAHDVRCVLEHVGVAGNQRWHRATQDLPDREVPRHYRQDWAQRTVFDARLAVFNQG